MTTPRYDVAGIGNAIVDVLAYAEDAKLAELGVAKGVMTLIDANAAESVYAGMEGGVTRSGGSAANTMAGIAALGGRAAFVGKVKDDPLGRIFRRDLRAQGVDFDTPAASSGAATARCLIMVTPDAQRTMQTYLGACVELGPQDIDPKLIQDSGVTYLEGYLWDPPRAREGLRRAIGYAREAGRKVALTLSDPFCVDRHRDEFLGLLDGQVDILFANEQEIASLFQCNFDQAVGFAGEKVQLAALTRSARGSVAVQGKTIAEVPADPVDQLVDTTGAGDLYAAGFLVGNARGLPLADCARLGSICASEIISHIGARPEADLKQLANKAGLLL